MRDFQDKSCLVRFTAVGGCKIPNWHDPAHLTSCGLCLEIGQFSYLPGFTIALLHPLPTASQFPGLWLVTFTHPWPLIGGCQTLTTLGRAGSSVTGCSVQALLSGFELLRWWGQQSVSGGVILQSISNRNRIDSTADNSRWLHPDEELCNHCCWCWQWMRKRWCWRCWCDDEMRRDDLTAADGSRPVWDDILMWWYPHTDSHVLIMKMEMKFNTNTILFKNHLHALNIRSIRTRPCPISHHPDDSCCSISRSGQGWL